MPGPVGQIQRRFLPLRNGIKVVMERSANINGNSKTGMTDPLSGFGVEESWGPDPLMNGGLSKYKCFQ